jgi:hypothetical protein
MRCIWRPLARNLWFADHATVIISDIFNISLLRI